MLKLICWRAVLLLAVVSSVLLTPLTAMAQKLSDRPITIVVPTTPGVTMDFLARILAEELKQRWGQAVVVENKAGASHSIAILAVTRAEPDGHTLLSAANTLTTNVGLFKTMPYDPVKGLAPIVKMATSAMALAVNPSVPAKSVREFIDYANKHPGQVHYASTGQGTPQHLAMELFKLATGVDVGHVPYPGSAGALRDLVGGFVNAMFIPAHSALSLAAGNKIRLLAISGPKRSPHTPDVPTLAEAGVSSILVDSWYGLLATGGTSKEIVERYNKVVNEFLASPKGQSELAKQGLTPEGGSAAEFSELIVKDLARWTAVVKEAGIVPN